MPKTYTLALKHLTSLQRYMFKKSIKYLNHYTISVKIFQQLQNEDRYQILLNKYPLRIS